MCKKNIFPQIAMCDSRPGVAGAAVHWRGARAGTPEARTWAALGTGVFPCRQRAIPGATPPRADAGQAAAPALGLSTSYGIRSHELSHSAK